MNRNRFFRMALIPAAAISLSFPGGMIAAVAQSPPTTPPEVAAPVPSAPAPAVSDTPVTPVPATPPPSPPAVSPPGPPPPPASAATPPTTPPPPASAETPTTTPPAVAVQTADPFGEEIMLSAKTALVAKGEAKWDDAFETLTASLKSLSAFLEKQGIKPSGNAMIVYTSTDDSGFTYQAEIPVDRDPKNLTKTMSIGKTPEGRSLKFVHRGSYDNMDNTYEAITNYLDDKKLEAKDTFIEEYVTDPLTTAEDKLVINVYVPLK
jgi:effector-binding domain-containing protein